MTTNNYCTIEDVKNQLVDAAMMNDYDVLLEAMTTRASRLIDTLVKKWPGYFYVTTDTTRYFNGSGTYHQWIDEMAALPTSVSVSETGSMVNYTLWEPTDYTVYPYNALSILEPIRRLDIDILNGSKATWYSFKRSVKIVGKFGWSITIPPDIQEATIIQCVRWFKRGQQGFADASAIEGLGRIIHIQAMDPEVAMIVKSFGNISI